MFILPSAVIKLKKPTADSLFFLLKIVDATREVCVRYIRKPPVYAAISGLLFLFKQLSP